MIIEVHENLQKPFIFRATRLLATTEDGTPFAFIIEYAPGHYRAFAAGQPGFTEQLHLHGFDRTVVVTAPDLSRGRELIRR